MGRRKPNHYGCVTKLKGKRSRPWVVKVTVYDAEGHGKQVPIDYAETEEQANIILAQYNDNPWSIDRNKVTLVDLYQRWAKIKLPKMGQASRGAMKSAFKHCQKYYGMKYRSIRAYQMQDCIDSYKQFMNIKKHMRDEKTGLYYHGYDESRQMYWADPVTGCSPNFWLRAMGWFMVAMVDVLERMDEQLYNEYRGIMAQLRQTIEDVHKFQDEETGMFWQVMDHPGVEGNYLETSGTALFAYAVLKGVRLGYLPKRMAAWAEKAFYGTCDRYLSKNPDGSLQLDGICLVAGLGGKDHRDGSLAYYFSEPVVCNDAKGVGPLVLAYTEMIARK